MGIIGAALFPHPPIVLPEVGRGQERGAAATIKGMEDLAGLVAELKPEVVAVMTPHGPAFADVIAASAGGELAGDMGQFGAPQVRITKKVSRELLKLFQKEASASDVPLALLDGATLGRLKAPSGLDHGALVPLYFIEKKWKDYTILHLSPGGPTLRRQFAAGQALRRAADKSGLRVLVLSSGDMSHRLSASGPYGFDEAGPRFDAQIVDAIKSNRPEKILAIDAALARKAGECGWKSAVFSLGALDGDALECRFLSYEGPFGVGYMTALITPTGGETGSRLNGFEQAAAAHAAQARAGEDNYVRLARETIERYVRTGAAPKWADMKETVGGLDAVRMERRKAGAFVSLHLEGELRGCMGTILPTAPHVGEEIIRNAVTACSEDPRFPGVDAGELPDLEVKVDVLSPFEPVKSPRELDPQRYGVIVERGGRRGLLLPKLEGVDTVTKQLDIACRKAGFLWDEEDESIKLYRFTVERHGEED
jgi:AmmeMemoRadiSam system protein A